MSARTFHMGHMGQLGQIGGSNMGCQGTHNFGQFEVWFLYVSLLCVQ
jgi:hypothetical protein